MSKKDATCDHCGERAIVGWSCPDCNRFFCNFCCDRTDAKPEDRGVFTVQRFDLGTKPTCPVCSKKSGEDNCFIATACCESHNAPEVIILKNFRDDYLLESKWGKTFVTFYYKYSPFIAKKITSKTILKTILRSTLVSPAAWILQEISRLWKK